MPLLRSVEREVHQIFAKRFARQAEIFAPALIRLLPNLVNLVQADEEPPDEVMRLIDLTFDGTIDEADRVRLISSLSQASRSGASVVIRGFRGRIEEPDQFLMVNREAVAWIANHTNELFRSVDETTKRRIGRSLARGLEEGEHLDALAKRVARNIGEGGWRARMIAQSETINAYSQGTERSAAALNIPQLQWLDGQAGACPICRNLHEVVKNTGSVFVGTVYTRDNPPAHPACRCVVIPYMDVS